MHGQEPESEHSAKYLEVNISANLRWNSHISKITSTAIRTLCFVKRNGKTKYKEIKPIALVRPQVEYAYWILSPYTKENTEKVKMVQRRAARWVTNDYSPYSSVSNVLSNLGWRRLRTDATMRASLRFTR